MNGPQNEAAQLLKQVLELPSEQRETALRAAGPLEVVFATLARHIEKLAMTHCAAALEASREIVALADRTDHARGRIDLRRAYAQSLAYAGRFEDALPVCEEARRLAEDHGLLAAAAEVRLASVHALVHLARYGEAITAARTARDQFMAAGEMSLAGRAESSLGGIHQKLDEPQKALEHFERARDLLKSDPIACAQAESNRGLALLSLDDFAGAEAAQRAALPVFEAARMAWAAAIVEGNLAALATRRGRIAEALHLFERVRRRLERDAAPAELARVLVEQADALVVLRELALALKQYRVALPVLQRHGQVREAVQARAGIGQVLALQGRADEADHWLAESIAQYDALRQAREQAALEVIRAQLALRNACYDQARASAQRALELAGERPIEAAAARYQLARAELAEGRTERALAVLAPAVKASEALDIAPLRADLLHARGLISKSRGDREAARADFRAAVGQVERVRGSLQADRFRAAFHADRLALYSDLIDTALDVGDTAALAEAFTAAEQARSRALLDRLAGHVEHAAAIPAAHPAAQVDLLAELAQLRGELNGMYSRLAEVRFARLGEPGHLPEKIRARQQRIQHLEARLATARGPAGLYAQPVDLATLQAQLPAAATVVEFLNLADELAALVITREEIRAVRRLTTLPDLRARSERLHFQVGRGLRPGANDGSRGARLRADVQRELQTLHDWLVRPLDLAVERPGRLYFVPHGVLHTLPLHALWDGKRYLIERGEIVYAPSASLLVQLHTPRDTRAVASSLVVGVADEHAPLIENEARAIADTLNAHARFFGPDATVARVTAAASGAGLIHLACHGQFACDNPQGSGLRLADRWLTVSELYNLRLNAALLTLSGCETGRNRVGAGDDLLGLVRAFLAAGATRLVVSLWTVHDESAVEMMQTFYNRLGRDWSPATTATALRSAQLELLERRPHPALWAPFILIGGT